MHPKPKFNKSLLFNLSSETFVLKTPVQKKIVKGFDAVRISAYKNELLLLILKILKYGIIFKPNALNIIFNPNTSTIKPLNILKNIWYFSFLIIDSTPRMAITMYKASTIVTAITENNALIKFVLIAVVNINKQTGPTAN